MIVDDAQLAFCVAVRQTPRQLTLRELVNALMPEADAEGVSILKQLNALEKTLELLGLSVSPPISDGNLDATRLVSATVGAASRHRVQAEIATREDQGIELKSTFACCMKTLAARSDLEPKQYKKHDVEYSCLSAIAGMMNTSGGVVLVGVDDSRKIVGLEPDYRALQVSDSDRWLLYVRSKIVSAFVDGRAVSGHIDVTFHEIDSLTVARMAIQARQRLALLKNLETPSCPPRLLRRLNNQTIEVDMDSLEDFFAQRTQMRIVGVP